MDLNNRNNIKGCKKCLVNCPALMSDGHFFTNWEPRKDFNLKLNYKLKTDDSHIARKLLINMGRDIENPNKELYLCKNNQLIDGSIINKYFDKLLFNELSQKTNIMPYEKQIKN